MKRYIVMTLLGLSVSFGAQAEFKGISPVVIAKSAAESSERLSPLPLAVMGLALLFIGSRQRKGSNTSVNALTSSTTYKNITGET